MSVGINASLIYASIRDSAQKRANLWADQTRSSLASGSSGQQGASPCSPASGSSNRISSARAFESSQRITQSKQKSVVDQSISYADSLRASRAKAKETSTEKKKLQYSYKKISSQIVMSKDSISAKRAAAAARREVQRLKRLKASGEYDDEELQISIDHAKSMERIANKKVIHLEQEEMIERGHKGTAGGLEEREKDQQETDELEDKNEELSDGRGEGFSSETAALQEELNLRMQELQESFQDEITEASLDSTTRLQDEMMAAMEEMLEEMDLDELADTLVAPDPDMSADDLKMLKLKHRTKEMKDIAKADGDYLKAIMDKYEKKGVAGMDIGASCSTGFSAFSGALGTGSSPTPISVTIPAAYGSESVSMSFDALA